MPILPVFHRHFGRQILRPGCELIRLAPALDQRIEVVARAALDEDEYGIGKQGVQVRHAQAVLVVLVDPAMLTAPAVEITADRVAIRRTGILRIQRMGIPVLVGQRMQAGPVIVGFALQAADFMRFGQGFVNQGGAGTRTADHDDGPLRRRARKRPARTAHTALNAPRMVGKSFAYFNQKFAQQRCAPQIEIINIQSPKF